MRKPDRDDLVCELMIFIWAAVFFLLWILLRGRIIILAPIIPYFFR